MVIMVLGLWDKLEVCCSYSKLICDPAPANRYFYPACILTRWNGSVLCECEYCTAPPALPYRFNIAKRDINPVYHPPILPRNHTKCSTHKVLDIIGTSW